MINIIELFDSIGYTGPILILLINIYTFFYRKPYLYAYLISIFVNSFVNSTLKNIYRIPRQDNQIPFSKYENFDGVNAYGMPSGHAQSVGFSTIFLFFSGLFMANEKTNTIIKQVNLIYIMNPLH